MTGKIFLAVWTAAVAVLTASIILIMGVLYGYFNDLRKNELKTELSIVADAVEDGGIDYLDNLNTDSSRITWINKDGKVLFDSKTDTEKMENHIEREEVKEALENGSGESERYSSTITEKTIYCAKLLEDGTVLRISAAQATVPALLLGTAQPIAIVFVISVAVSFVLASGISKKIVKPINNLDLENPLENDTYDEISPLLKRIALQNKKIKNQKEELNQRKAEFLATTLNMNEGLILLGTDKRIISLNPAAESFLALRTEASGKPFIEIERNPDIIRSLLKAETDDRSEVRIERDSRIYQLNISCIRDLGNMSGFVILIFDITEKVDSEKRRREFTANVSHELKTPLQSILGSAELIENGMVKQENLPEFAGNIRTEAQRLVTLIDDIIRLSKLDEGTGLPKAVFNLAELIQENIDLLMPFIEKKNISLTVDTESIDIESIRPLCSGIIFNLLDNAIKYNKYGGSITVTSKKDENGVFFKVEDTGIGIPAEHQERIFERFYRVDKSRSKETGGTGLGLSIVKHSAEDIGADVTLESKLGKGTAVTIRFKA